MGLRQRGLLAGNRTLRDASFFNRPDGLAGCTIKYVGKSGLRDLGYDFHHLAVNLQIHQVRGGSNVVVPDTVMDRLKMPDSFASFCVDTYQALGV